MSNVWCDIRPMKTPTIETAATGDVYPDPDVRIGGQADLDGHRITLCSDVMDFREIIDTVIHETLHLVLAWIDEYAASRAIDNTYEDYHKV